MRTYSRTLLTLGLVLMAAAAASAQGSRCTREALPVSGTTLTVGYCVVLENSAAPGHDLPVQVTESYTTGRGSFTQANTLQFISGETASRVIEDVALNKVGLQGTLHLTLVYRGGLVRIESALLTPGAITIK